MQGRIFISYRRADSQYATDRIYERLTAAFGAEAVFMDIDNIPLGVNFRDYIDQQVSTSSVVLAVIGDRWLDAVDAEGNRRLENPSDFVRLELEAALQQGIKLIPVFLGDVKAVPGHKLPKSLQELPMLNATRIRSGHDFLPDLDRLIRGIEHISKEQDARREKNKAALAELKASASEIKQQLAQVEALMIQETRKRTRLEKQAQKIEAQVDDSLLDPGKTLLVDVEAFQQEVDKLTEGLYELALQVEARKQGHVIEDEPLPELEEKETEPVIKKPAPKPERKPLKPKVAKPRPDIGKTLSKVPIWFWGVAAVVVIGVVFGIIFGPDLYQSISASRSESGQPIPTVEPNKVPTSGSADLEDLSGNQEVLDWIDQIDLTTPDFIEDFSIPQAYWYHDFWGLGLTSHDGSVTEGVLRIVKDTEESAEVSAGRYPFGDNALLLFGFNPDNIEQNTAVLVSFREEEDTGYTFYYQANGNWNLEAVEGNNRTILANGNSFPLESGKFYQFHIFAYHNTLVVKLNGQILSYEVDDTYSEGVASIDLIVEGALEADLDNIQVWDLSEVALYEDLSISHDVQAKNFYTPIRQYLAMISPDFEEDFSQQAPYMEQIMVNDSTQTSMIDWVDEEKLKFDSTRFEAMEPVFNLSFPQMESGIAAVQLDFECLQMGPDNELDIFYLLGEDEGNLQGYIFANNPGPEDEENNKFRWRVDELYPEESSHLAGGDITLFNEPDSQYSLLAIFYQSQAVMFLDGHFLGYVDGLDLSRDHKLHFTLGYDDVVIANIDNIRYWDLSPFVVDFNGDLPSEEVSHFAQQILSHTNTQPPDFEEDFETPQSYWNTMRVDHDQNQNPVLLASVVQEGIAQIDTSVFDSDPTLTLHFEPVMATNFSYEFDFNVSDFGGMSIFFSGNEDGSASYNFGIGQFEEDGDLSWILFQRSGLYDETEIVSGLVEDPGFLSSQHHLSLNAYQGNLLVLLDGKVLSYHTGLELTPNYIQIYAGFGASGQSWQFDNFRFWNLDEVGFEF